MDRRAIPALSALAFTTTACMGVDKLDGSMGWSPTDIGPDESAAEEGGADGGDAWDEDEGWEDDDWGDDDEVVPYIEYGYSLVGDWAGIEFNGTELPYSYTEGTFGLYLSVEADYTGEMLLVQASGEYSFNVEASGSMPEYTIVAPEMGATLDCTLTDMEILDCAYSTNGSSESYSLVFARD